ncbi:hypothetical protein CLOP_g17372 [Closterium sp. NIES-67]|nr:hypothetical protein CLOP_g17372 [Closterium sp. NIES-67]
MRPGDPSTSSPQQVQQVHAHKGRSLPSVRSLSSGLLPSFRAISSYIRHVSSSADSLVASAVRSASASVAAALAPGDDSQNKEQVTWAGFGSLEDASSSSSSSSSGVRVSGTRRVLLVAYTTGFHVWDVQQPHAVRELASRRDGPAESLHPLPYVSRTTPESPLHDAHPVLCVVCPPAAVPPPSGVAFESRRLSGQFPYLDDDEPYADVADGVDEPYACEDETGGEQSVVRLYSLRSSSYVHSIAVAGRVMGVRSNRTVLAVAVAEQIYIYDLATLSTAFSVLTHPHPLPPSLPGIARTSPHGALALGPRWLAYPSNQPLAPHITTAPLPSSASSSSAAAAAAAAGAAGAGAALVAHYAKESGKQLAGGIAALGDLGVRTVSKYWTDMVTDSATGSGVSTASGGSSGASGVLAGSGSPWSSRSPEHMFAPDSPHASVSGVSMSGASVSGSSTDGYADASPRAGAHAAGLPSVPPVDPTHAGNVVVRDVATRAIIAHFRAHGSAIALLAFDCSGTLLLSASLCGHSLNVFRLTPAPTPANAPAAPALVDSKPQDGCSYVHLYRLHRGLTNAVIQSAAISHDSRWVAVSSARGTTHLFAISPFGGPVGPATHLPSPSSPTLLHPVYTHSPSLLPPPPPRPWWSSYAPLRFSSSPSHAPPPLRVPAPVALSSVARIRNANSGWRGNVTGVAAAAAGLGMEIPGAVAAAFHFGGVPGGGVLGGRGEAGHQQQQQQQQHQQVLAGQFYGQPEWAPPPIAEQLWVFSPLGHLIRYHLTPYAAASDPSSSSSSSPSHSHGRAMHPPNSYSQAYSSHTYDPRGSYLPPHGATSAGAMQPGRGAIPPFSPIPPFPPMAQSDSSVLGGRSFERLPSLPTLALRSAAAAAGVSVRGMGGGGTRAGGEVVLQVAAEASEVWDVCRRVSWSDRDEPIQGAWDAHSTAAAAASLDAAAGSSGRCSAEEGRQRAVEEAEQRAYLMHAEVQLTTSRATPLWARTYIRLQPEDSPSSSSHTASQSPTQGRTTHPPLPSHTPQGTPAVTGMGSSPPLHPRDSVSASPSSSNLPVRPRAARPPIVEGFADSSGGHQARHRQQHTGGMEGLGAPAEAYAGGDHRGGDHSGSISASRRTSALGGLLRHAAAPLPPPLLPAPVPAAAVSGLQGLEGLEGLQGLEGLEGLQGPQGVHGTRVESHGGVLGAVPAAMGSSSTQDAGGSGWGHAAQGARAGLGGAGRRWIHRWDGWSGG